MQSCSCAEGHLHQQWQHQDLLDAMQTLTSSGCCKTLHFHAIGDAAVMQAVQSCDQIICASSFAYDFGSRFASIMNIA